MKKIILFILCLSIIFAFTACDNNDNIPQNSTNEKLSHSSVSSEQTDKEKTDNTESKGSMNSSANKKNVRVVKNFFAVEGAVIYDTSF